MHNDVLIESLECAIILLDDKLIVHQVNIASETLFGTSRRYLLGSHLKDLLSDKSILTKAQECLESNAQFTLREVDVDVLHNENLVDMTLSCLNSNDKGSMVLLEMNQINRISRFIKEKNQLERQQSFRLVMRGLAHEIKNPLGGIRGAAQLLHREIDDPVSKELTDILIKEADRLTRLVDRVMGSREQLKLAKLNIHEVIEHVVHLVTVKSDVKLKIHRDYDPTLPEVYADKEQLIQAVLNIVGNAVEVQADKNFPTIGFVTSFARFVTINKVTHRRVMKLMIWDEGVGVIDTLKDKLFDPLVTDRPDGTGLGLSITQEIVQRHNGVVQLESYQGNTCFSIYIPYLENKDKKEGREDDNE